MELLVFLIIISVCLVVYNFFWWLLTFLIILCYLAAVYYFYFKEPELIMQILVGLPVAYYFSDLLISIIILVCRLLWVCLPVVTSRYYFECRKSEPELKIALLIVGFVVVYYFVSGFLTTFLITLVYLAAECYVYYNNVQTAAKEESEEKLKMKSNKPRQFHTELKRGLSCPLVRMWFPNGDDNKYGHVSIQTNNYYMSFWPHESLTGLGSQTKAGSFGVRASLHFHPDYDCTEEGNRYPDKRIYVNIVSCSDLDKLYEEFLRYNGVNPSNVSLQRGCHLRDKGVKPEMAIDRTKYTYLPNVKYEKTREFYRSGQSCVSFVYHMINGGAKRDISKQVTIEFFKTLIKLINTIIPPLEREVYVNVLCYTVDGRIVTEVEKEKVMCYLLNVEPPKLTLNISQSWKHETKNLVADIWTVPGFFQDLTNSIASFFNNNEQREVYNVA